MSFASHPGDPAELAALYASGSMTSDERLAFEAHLAEGCAQCRAEVTEYDELVVALSDVLAPQAPPSELRRRLLSRAAAERHDQPYEHEALEHEVHEHHPVAAMAERRGKLAPDLLVLKAGEGTWTNTDHEGVKVRMLYVDHEARQYTSLVRMAPGSSYPAHSHRRAEECLVLEGDLRFGDHVLTAGDFLRTSAGYHQVLQTTQAGCLLYLTTPFE
jgi:anti-sigma factor ChrR (cupin superfamily)